MLEGGEASSVSLSELPPPVCPGLFASLFESVGAVPQVLGLALLLAALGVRVVSTLGVLGRDEGVDNVGNYSCCALLSVL